jgi:hypothetical protein
LTADAAKVVMTGDENEVGLALRWALAESTESAGAVTGAVSRKARQLCLLVDDFARFM